MSRPSCLGLLIRSKPEKFTTAFAKHLDSICQIVVKEANNGDRVIQGLALIALGGKHMLLKRNGSEFIRHQAFVAGFDCTLYRCEAHSPWQRGQVEGENKNLRQYMPMGFNADRLTNGLLKDVEVSKRCQRKPLTYISSLCPSIPQGERE